MVSFIQLRLVCLKMGSTNALSKRNAIVEQFNDMTDYEWCLVFNLEVIKLKKNSQCIKMSNTATTAVKREKEKGSLQTDHKICVLSYHKQKSADNSLKQKYYKLPNTLLGHF